MRILVEALPLLVTGFAGSFVLFTVLWVVQRVRGDAGVVDIGWTVGVGTMAIAAAVTGTGWAPRRVLIGLLPAIWAFRLCAYILLDRVFATEEDGRYQRLRAYWGRRADAWFYLFFTSQSLLVILFAIPFLPSAADPRPRFGPLQVAGVALWIGSMAGEWIADRQLARFRAVPSNRGRTCREGLWRYSRHPNYFFEWLHWWAYVLIGITAPGGWLTLVGPVAMYLFLMYLTGIPYAEIQALASRGDDYREYQRTTSRFFPLPPRR